MPNFVFGNNPVYPSTISYISYPANDPGWVANFLILNWPFSYTNSPEVTAAMIELNPNGNASVYLPDVTEASVGQMMILRNLSEFIVLIYTSTGNLIGSLTPVSIDPLQNSGDTKYFYTVDNTVNAAASWHYINYGTGTSDINPIDLAGFGLYASGNTLNVDTTVKMVPVPGPGVNSYTPILSDDAQLLILPAGITTLNLPTGETSTFSNGYFFSVYNNSSGPIALTPQAPALLNGAGASIDLSKTYTTGIVFDGTNWWTIAKTDLASYNPTFPWVVPTGGTGKTSFPINSVIIANSTDATGPLQTVLTATANVGDSLTYQGDTSPPIWSPGFIQASQVVTNYYQSQSVPEGTQPAALVFRSQSFKATTPGSYTYVEGSLSINIAVAATELDRNLFLYIGRGSSTTTRNPVLQIPSLTDPTSPPPNPPTYVQLSIPVHLTNIGFFNIPFSVAIPTLDPPDYPGGKNWTNVPQVVDMYILSNSDTAEININPVANAGPSAQYTASYMNITVYGG